MNQRLFAVLVIVCFALGGAGCASESQIANREEILMPRQTGSTLQRRVMVKKDGATEKPKKKKDKKDKKDKKESKEKKSPTPKPTPAPEPTVEVTPEPTPAQPDRFR